LLQNEAESTHSCIALHPETEAGRGAPFESFDEEQDDSLERTVGSGNKETFNPPAPRPYDAGTIAILPFKQIGRAPDDQLGLAMSDALITRLSNIEGITVRPTSSVLRYGRRETDAVEAGWELNVQSVIDGFVQRFEDRIRITVQLISVRDGAPLWAGLFDDRITNLFTMQDRISRRRVAESLLLKFSGNGDFPNNRRRLAVTAGFVPEGLPAGTEACIEEMISSEES
jgi:TolB-like protein